MDDTGTLDSKITTDTIIPPSTGFQGELSHAAATSCQSFLSTTNIRSSKAHRRYKHLAAVAQVVQDSLDQSAVPFVCYFLTLTYKNCKRWSGDHITVVHKRLREWCRRHGYGYALTWGLDVSPKGRPHYHMLLWLPVAVPMSLIRSWWRHGFSKLERTRDVPGAARYIGKHCSIPHTFRLRGTHSYGHGGLTGTLLERVRYQKAPRWLRDRTSLGSKLRRKGSWWTIDDTIQLRSPWRVTASERGYLFNWVGWTEADVRLLVPGSLAGAAFGYRLDGLMEKFKGRLAAFF